MAKVKSSQAFNRGGTRAACHDAERRGRRRPGPP